ncbi:hypothetical protein B0A52_05917 [Exophiala mesophila]|uniref:Nucleoporin POM34 n=1 Tax=Exophiala mesophila TaxID=212818 RepID=A0A438N465_EXOME|nr:hypothetical protein B0A52_05917 [Exophiala mesophila]
MASTATSTSLMSSSVISTPSALVQKTKDIGSTPISKPKPASPTVNTPSPGTFRHPRTSEIIARQSATILTQTRINNACINAAVLLLTFFAGGLLKDVLTFFLSPELTWWLLWTIRTALFSQVILLLRPAIPYISKQDQITDIPLTPTQRALFGLDPSTPSTPLSTAPNSSYITPPKYRRLSGTANTTPTTSTDRRSTSANYSTSPLSTSRYTIGFSPTPSQSIRRSSGGPFSQSPSASPLFHKAVNQPPQNLSDLDLSASTRSFRTSGGLSRSQSLRDRTRRESLEPNSPTPGTGSPQLVPGVNYKWLYDKGRGLPKNDSYRSFF